VRRATLAAAALAGLVAGGAATLAVQPREPGPLDAPRLAPGDGRPGPPVLLVWTPGGLPADLAPSVARLPGVLAVSAVAGGPVDLVSSADEQGVAVDALEDGWRIPLDAAALDPARHAAFVPADSRAAVAGRVPGRALLGATSARLRGVAAGGRLRLATGTELVVAGVVDDALVGAAEVVVSPDDGRALGLVPRYLLVAHDGERAAVERAVRSLLPPATPVRFRAPGETPFLREGDAVLPQALVKDRFGEFAYRPGPGRAVELDPAWAADHLVTATVPLLGRVRCHRALLLALEGALADLEAASLGYLVKPEGFAGCWAPRRIAPGAPLSRHAWGIAFDVGLSAHPTGVSAAHDARLLAVMRRWGFTSGADWLVPDPAHFEYLRPPSP
jgi:hypothetical protein